MVTVSDAEVRALSERGYLVLASALSREEIDAWHWALRDVDARVASSSTAGVEITWEPDQAPGDARRILQLLHVEEVSPELRDLVASDRLLDIVEDVLGPDIALFQAKLLMKSDEIGSAVPWHQDFPYWRGMATEPSMLNCMIYLDDADEDNGCLTVIPGSHQLGCLDHEALARSNFPLATQAPKEREQVALPGPAGTVVLFGPLLVHGSGPNTSTRPRRACTIVFTVPGNGTARAILRRGEATATVDGPPGDLPRITGPGPHGGQCAAHYRRRELWNFAVSCVGDRSLPWCQVGTADAGALEWLASRKPIGTRLVSVNPFQPPVTPRADVVQLRHVSCLLDGDGGQAIDQQLGFVHLQHRTHPAIRDALGALAPHVDAGTVIVVDHWFGDGDTSHRIADTVLGALRGAGRSVDYLAAADEAVALRVTDAASLTTSPDLALAWRPKAQGIAVGVSAPVEAEGPAGAEARTGFRASAAVQRERWRVRLARLRWELPPIGRLFPRSRVPLLVGAGHGNDLCASHAERRALWRYALSFVEDETLPWAEFGVGAGETLDWFSWHKPLGNIVLGFDSFEGIPEPWLTHPQGHWRSEPYVSDRDDVVIVRGAFDESLRRPEVLERLGPRIAFAHIDCDLYSSTRTVFDAVAPFLGNGSVLVFDEFYGYLGWERQEGGAFLDFCKARSVAFEYLARTSWQVAVRIVDIGGGLSVACRPFEDRATLNGTTVTFEPHIVRTAMARLRSRAPW